MDERLSAALSFSRPGKRFADIGTDHAYLPIELCKKGISCGGVAADINKGPLMRAKKNISDSGLSDKIAVFQTDGLSGIERFEPQDVYVLGMGGELISRIVGGSAFIKNPGIRLILQPMTHAEDVRKTLDGLGFEITDETIVRDGRRFYQVICADYSGKTGKSDELELILGKRNIEKGGETFRMYVSFLMKVYEKRISGLKSSGADCSGEEEMLGRLTSLAEAEKE